MTIELFAYDTPNARKISVALEEMGLPFAVRIVDITRGEQFEPPFLEISPNGKIPAIIDREGPDGQPISVFESGAILIYLGQKTGAFWPPAPRDQVRVLEWLMFQVGGFGPIPGQAHHFLGLKDPAEHSYAIGRFQRETERLYQVMDRRLAETPYFAGDLSIADFAILGWAWRHARHRVSLDDYSHVRRWYDSLMARPGVQRGFERRLS